MLGEILVYVRDLFLLDEDLIVEPCRPKIQLPLLSGHTAGRTKKATAKRTKLARNTA
jgi:hypothetical protein